MSQLRDIAQNEMAGDESHRDEELRQAVGRVVLEGMITGYGMVNGDDNVERNLQNGDSDSTKRRRLDQPDSQL
jgi:hypothetical protein